MARILSLITILLLTTFTTSSYAQTVFTATLESAQVVGGPTMSTATGTATLTLNPAQDALTYSITLIGLDLDGLQTPGNPNDNVNSIHFHAAPPGANGPVVFGLIGPNHDADDLVINAVAGTLNGVWENTDANPLSTQLANLFANDLYLNVHTPVYPGGEIRGQVMMVVAPRSVPIFGGTSIMLLILLLAGLGTVFLRRNFS